MLDPDDYDADELRRIARQRPSPGDGFESARGTESEEHRGSGRRGDDGSSEVRHPPDGERRQGTNGHGRYSSHESGDERYRDDGPTRARRRDRDRARDAPSRERAASGRDGSFGGDRSERLEQLFLYQAAAGDDLQRPYLRAIPREYAAERVVFRWLDDLVTTAGFRRAMGALRFYRSIDWITEEVEAELQDYLVGFSTDVGATRDLDTDDHQQSLVYLAQLASMA